MNEAAVVETPAATPPPVVEAPVAQPRDYGEVTTDGVTVFSNQRTTEQLREEAGKVSTEKKPNPRKDMSARIQEQATEIANRDQTISTLNERLAQIDDLKKEIETLKAPKAAPVVSPESTAAPTAFTEAEPKLEQFAGSDDQYRDFLRALARYDARKDAFEQKQASQKTQAETDAVARDANFKTFIESKRVAHDTRLNDFVKSNPAALDTLKAAGDLPLTPLMYAAIELDDNGPAFMMELAQHPELVDELVLQTANQPVFDRNRNMNPLVSILQRKLTTRLGAADTGSAPKRPSTNAHPPINPVVGSQPKAKTGPPDPETSSQEEYDAYWNDQEREAKRSGRRR